MIQCSIIIKLIARQFVEAFIAASLNQSFPYIVNWHIWVCSSQSSHKLAHYYLLCLPLLFLLRPLHASALFPFDAIYQFGDSSSDTGNLILEDPTAVIAFPPYGQTYFHRPTGRASDGLLMIDFIAKSYKLPLLNPYLAKDADFSHGVNFAVAGATALNTSALTAQNIVVRNTNSSLSVQLGWFRTHLSSICSSKIGSKPGLVRALFVVGGIGVNDFSYALTSGKSMQYLYNLVPSIVQSIKVAVEEVIDHGAVRVLVPGYGPFGCVSAVLAAFASNNASMYDELKCLKNFNELSKYGNLQLQQAVKELQNQHPSVIISYGDVYSASMWLFQNADSLGFEKDGELKACCGSGDNAYNYNSSMICGMSGVSACPDPTKRVNWDGFHLTHQAYMHLTARMLPQIIF